jgi:hypothetical protein
MPRNYHRVASAKYWAVRPGASALHVHRGHLLILLRSVVRLRSVPARPLGAPRPFDPLLSTKLNEKGQPVGWPS